MIKTNKDSLPIIGVMGKTVPPQVWGQGGSIIDQNGVAHKMPAVGGIAYNVTLGDNCMKIRGDHFAPGVSTRGADPDSESAWKLYACLGNKAVIIDGPLKGKEGMVFGNSGGCRLKSLIFDKETTDQMIGTERFLVKAKGFGTEIEGFPNVQVGLIDPDLLEKMVEEKDGKLEVHVKRVIPADMMGGGVGNDGITYGDYEIMTDDPELYKKYNLGELCFGDLVLLTGTDTTFYNTYIRTAVTFGVIVHGDSLSLGHGPGVMPIVCSKEEVIVPVMDENANIINYVKEA